ncbi:MAG: bifunctional DNA primase/polymerase [Perlabentimonas sp.]
MIIPNQLQQKQFRFVKICMTGKSARKRPLEPNWQDTNNYTFDDPQLQTYIQQGNNYGVVCGYGKLAVIDADEKDFAETVEQVLPETFTVKTGSGGRHFYYIIPDLERKLILFDQTDDEEKHLGEIQYTGAQVIAPNSVHPNNNRYIVIKDIPIATLSNQCIQTVFRDYIKKQWVRQTVTYNSNKTIDIAPVVDLTKLTQHREEYMGSHPVHGSTTGNNFAVNPTKNTWHCFRCNSGGGALLLIAVMEGILPCHQAHSGALSGDIFKKVLKIAQTKYKLEIPKEVR